MLLDGETFELVPASAELIEEAGEVEHGQLKTELFASVIELNDRSLRHRRRGRRRAAGRSGGRRGRGRRAGSGFAPGGRGHASERRPGAAGDRRRPSLPRVRRVRRRVGQASGRERPPRPRRDAERRGVLRRARGRCCPGCRWCSRSRRTRRTSRARRPGSPRTAPRSSRSCLAAGRRRPSARSRAGSASWSASSRRASRTATRASGGTSRPHPKFGTLEVRMPDQPTALERTVAFTPSCRRSASTSPRPATARPADRGVYQQNRWAALRYGADAELLHPLDDRTATRGGAGGASCWTCSSAEPTSSGRPSSWQGSPTSSPRAAVSSRWAAPTVLGAVCCGRRRALASLLTGGRPERDAADDGHPLRALRASARRRAPGVTTASSTRTRT